MHACMHVRTHAALLLVPASEAIYKHIPARHVAGKRFALQKSVQFFFCRCYFLAHACFSTVINNRIIQRAWSNASLATLSGIISSGLIVHYYFDV